LLCCSWILHQRWPTRPRGVDITRPRDSEPRFAIDCAPSCVFPCSLGDWFLQQAAVAVGGRLRVASQTLTSERTQLPQPTSLDCLRPSCCSLEADLPGVQKEDVNTNLDSKIPTVRGRATTTARALCPATSSWLLATTRSSTSCCLASSSRLVAVLEPYPALRNNAGNSIEGEPVSLPALPIL
jgi:hypothetical protein